VLDADQALRKDQRSAPDMGLSKTAAGATSLSFRVGASSVEKNGEGEVLPSSALNVSLACTSSAWHAPSALFVPLGRCRNDGATVAIETLPIARSAPAASSATPT
jgi:hypothetical protein